MASEARITAAIEARREVVNEAIPEVLPIQSPDRLYEATRYLLDAGGKRLRPAVLLLVGESLVDVEPLAEPYDSFPDLQGGQINLLYGAISVEIIHLFTLIHDDIMDDDDLRRGVPSVHRAFDLETAILAGDTLYSKAFEIALESGAGPNRTVGVLDQLATTCTEICEGQALDIGFETQEAVSLDDYHDMIRRKTAVLYGASAAVPAILLGADDDTVETLYRFGIDVGQAFQIQDDVLDLTGSSESLGKTRGSDLIEGKQTVVTMHAAERGVDLDEILGDEPDEETIDAAVEALQAAGSIDYARDTARQLVLDGKDHLSVLPDNEARDILGDLADYLIERDY